MAQPELLSRLNERQVLRLLHDQGPLSRAELARRSGMSPPTASKAVDSLLRAGWIEEGAAAGPLRGRPARLLRLASERAQVAGLVIDAERCVMVSAGLGGNLNQAEEIWFPTPSRYETLLTEVESRFNQHLRRPDRATLGMGICIPGLIDYRRGRGALSPNVPMTDDRPVAADLQVRLGVECVLVQEANSLCLAERWYGAARGLDDYAVMDFTTGVGVGVMSGGRLVTGHSGLAGEMGHVTVQADGRPCGCGNRGCLETLACDRALAGAVARRLEAPLRMDEVFRLAATGEISLDPELDEFVTYLSIGVAMVLNAFNPAALFLHGHLFAVRPELFEQVVRQASHRALRPSFADCRIELARATKHQGAVAAVIEHLTSALVPLLPADLYGATERWTSAPRTV